MSAPQRPRIAVAGAGIGGLTTALALLAKGMEVEVFEQASQLAEVGAGLQISPNGVKVLQSLGLTESLLACVSPAQGKEIRMWNTGQRWKLFDLGADCQERFGAPYWMVHRGDLHQVLLTAFWWCLRVLSFCTKPPITGTLNTRRVCCGMHLSSRLRGHWINCPPKTKALSPPWPQKMPTHGLGQKQKNFSKPKIRRNRSLKAWTQRASQLNANLMF